MSQQTESRSVLWRRIDQPGHESAFLSVQSGGWNLRGTAVFSHEELACRLDYQIICDSQWRTQSAKVNGWVGNNINAIELSVSPGQCWRFNEKDVPEVTGCVDLDLNFSPLTNLLPIRRLNLAVGESAEVRAAWLRFPSFSLEPLVQIYRRLDETTYRYESDGGSFERDLSVNSDGFVIRYPGIWEVEFPLHR